MIGAIGGNERKRGEVGEDLLACLWTAKTLQQLLKDQARRGDNVARFERTDQRADFWDVRSRITTERERPDAGIDEEVQRERSRL